MSMIDFKVTGVKRFKTIFSSNHILVPSLSTCIIIIIILVFVFGFLVFVCIPSSVVIEVKPRSQA
jgi:hypothetical protein